MKALSMWQPWAQLVVLGAKSIDTRSWKTKHEGWIWIHASKRVDRIGRELASQDPVFIEALGSRNFAALPRGAIIGAVYLFGCFSTEEIDNGHLSLFPVPDVQAERHFGDFSDGRFGWYLKYPIRFRRPYLINGLLGLWKPDSVPAELRDELLAHRIQTGRKFLDSALVG